MEQKNIREHNGTPFSVTEASTIFKELNDRTASNETGYNSMGELITKVKGIEENQTSGVLVYTNLVDLPATGELLQSYKVSNDTTSSDNNGYYHWNGSAYVKDAGLVETVVDEANTSKAVSGSAVHAEVKKNTYKFVIPHYNSTYNTIRLSQDRKTITFDKNGFSVIIGNERHNINGTNDKVINAGNGSPIRGFLYLDVSKLVSPSTSNWDTITDLLYISSENLVEDDVLLAMFYILEWSFTGSLESIVNKNYTVPTKNIAFSFFTAGSIPNYVLCDSVAKTITFPTGFAVQDNKEIGGRLILPSQQDVSYVCTDIDDNLWGSSEGVLIINRTTLVIKHLYWGHYNANIYNDYVLFGHTKRSSGSTSVGGTIQIMGFFPYKTDGELTYNMANKNRTIYPAYILQAGGGTVTFNTTALTITFPINFTVWSNAETSPKITLTSAQEVSLVCTDIGGTPIASSSGGLIIHNTTKQIIHIQHYDLNVNNYRDYTLFGIIQRSSASTSVAGEIQVIGFFPYNIDGSSSSSNPEEDLILRNMEVFNPIDASAYTKSGTTISRNLQLLIATDIHGDTVATNHATMLVNKFPTIDGGINLGDNTASDYTDDFSFVDGLLNSGKPFLNIVGNHDVGNSTTVALCGTNAEAYTRFIQPYEAEIGGVHAGKNYYYKDFATYKIRIIALYEYDDPNDLDTDPDFYKIQRGQRVWSQAQIDWFIASLLSTPTDYSVVIAMHQVIDFDMTIVAGLFSDSNVSSFPFLQNRIDTADGNPIVDIVDSFINGTAIDNDYSFHSEASYLSDINATTDFVSRGAGKFICYLSGHHHQDVVSKVTSNPDQLQINFVCSSSSSGQNVYGDLHRKAGEKSEDALTVISFDTTNKKIKLVRIGATTTYDMRERKIIEIAY